MYLHAPSLEVQKRRLLDRRFFDIISSSRRLQVDFPKRSIPWIITFRKFIRKCWEKIRVFFLYY